MIIGSPKMSKTPKTLILSHADVRTLIAMNEAVPAVEGAFAAHARGSAKMPSKVYLSLDQHGGDFRAMPAYFPDPSGASAGVKWVNSHPNNPAKHRLPAVMAVYVLSDPDTAVPLAIMDGTVLTAARTGAAAAVASKFLAKKSPKSIGFVGSGVQSRWLLDAHRVLFGDGLQVVANDVRKDAAEAFAREVNGRVGSVEEACACDIVCTSTPVREPVILRSFIRNGTHINAMGADAPGKQELETTILFDAKVVIDDWDQATHSGEVNVPIHDGVYDPKKIHGTLGEIAIGKALGRVSDDEITLFDSTGLAIQDVALARVVYAAARKKGLGSEIEIVG